MKTTSDNLIEMFLCIVEIIDIILGNNNRLTKLDQEKAFDVDLYGLFGALTNYFQLKTSPILVAKLKLCVQIDSIGFKFCKHIQKYLLKSVVNRQMSENELDKLIKSYFTMIFAYLTQPNVEFHCFAQKLSMSEMALQFWRTLNGRLKRSNELGEFLVEKICKSWVTNFYFRTVSPSRVEKGALPLVVKQEKIQQFNQTLLFFLNEIFNLNAINHFSCLFFVYSMYFTAKCDKQRKQSKKFANLSLNCEGGFSIEDEVYSLEFANLR